ncbi:MAG: hypothetical protein JHC87_08225 [Thermoleophilaceae bacterium]|nr:hypothetical protein [Thermoleophilaceae bacterium]
MTHAEPKRRASITAGRFLSQAPEHIYAFLSQLENHISFHDRYLRLVRLRPDGQGASMVIGSPLGLHRSAKTTITTARVPSQLGGTAAVGRHTTAYVCWTIAPHHSGAHVELDASVLTASRLDKLLLAVGGRWWLQRRFDRVLARLAIVLEPQKKPAPA